MNRKPNPIIHSFPVQLLFNNIRRNIALLLVWVILIMAISRKLGSVYGIHYLFLDPEYLGQVNFWSFFIVGIAFGQLTMAFHVACYILDSHRYTFLGAQKRPFAHFSLNNSVIPLGVFFIYMVSLIRFQMNNEFAEPIEVIESISGLVVGTVTLLVIAFYYFLLTNRDIFKDVAGGVDKKLRKSGISRERMMRRFRETKDQHQRFPVHNFVTLGLRIRKIDQSVYKFDREAILKVFDQNHINSVIIGLLLIIILVLLGGFIENPVLQIPAAASSILLFTVGVVLLGSVSFWFRAWGFPFFVAILFVINLGVKKGFVTGMHAAKGLNYSGTPAPYKLDSLKEMHSLDIYYQDIHDTEHALENWKEKQAKEKPKMIFLCVSGGGQRSALWSLNAMQKVDSVLDGTLMSRSTLISGASGGMIGAAYYRELYLRSRDNYLNPNDPVFLEKISTDNLNPVVFSLLVNDSFLSFREFEYDGKYYKKDRGYAFEHSLNNNIDNVLDKKLWEYKKPEEEGAIPTMILSPTIANDGRKLYITSRSFSFMNIDEDREKPNIRGVDFLRLFDEQDAQNLSFITALRMSASFPYITPTVSLPSKPRMEIMDAGIADNFGVSDALRFAYVFKDWILENTSGVVMIMIRDTEPNERIHARPIPSLLDRLTYPIASVYNNLSSIQDRKNDAHLEQAREWLGGNLDVVHLVYGAGGELTEQERASLSWHLTTREKQTIVQSIESDQNKKALNQIRALFHGE